jgi:hypothetical protein
MTELTGSDTIAVVNIGLPMFGDAIRDQDRPVRRVDPVDPAGGDPTAVRALTLLDGTCAGPIDAANREVVRRLDEGTPQPVRMATIGDVPSYAGRALLQCGPPISYGQACDPLSRSLRAAAVAEGWATDVAEADALLERGEIALDAANHHDTVRSDGERGRPVPAGVVVKDADGGTQAFSPVTRALRRLPLGEPPVLPATPGSAPRRARVTSATARCWS